MHRRIVTRGASPGLITTTTADSSGQRLVHLVNVSPVPQKFTLDVAGEPFGDGAHLELPARSGLMLPAGTRLGGAVLRWATAELDGPGEHTSLALRRGEGPGRAFLDTDSEIVVDGDGEVVRPQGGGVLVTWPGGACGERLLVRLG
ncbi:hypothetical protein [Streptomyces sp. NPDC055134]